MSQKFQSKKIEIGNPGIQEPRNPGTEESRIRVKRVKRVKKN